ncbi:MAG: lysophospholipid acyltransferase family protein [Akkermansiaceae bacterium]
MSQPQPPSPKPADYPAYALYRVFEFGLRFLPMEMVWILGYGLGIFGWAAMNRRRRAVIRNLRIAYGKELSREQIGRLALRTFCHAGANLMCSFRSTTMSQKELRDRVRVNHVERANSVRDNRNGGILLLAHMGNWEVLAQLPVILFDPPPFGTLYRPLDNPLIDRLVRKRRQQQGVKTYSRRDGFFKPISHLKEGGFLGTIADQHAGRHGISLPLFGKLTSMTNLPALLHRRSGASIIPIAMCTRSPGRWQLEVLPILDLPEAERKNTHQATRTTTSLYERILKESPADVLWMHSYWRVGQRRPLNIDGVQKEGSTDEILQPFRVIVYTADLKPENQEIAEQLKRLKTYRPDIHITSIGLHHLFLEADHHITIDPTDPPHLTSNAIRTYDLDCPAPIDCALDFTDSGRGGKLFAKAGLDRIFCRSGKWMSNNTRKIHSKHGTVSISDFLTSIGLDDETD